MWLQNKHYFCSDRLVAHTKIYEIFSLLTMEKPYKSEELSSIQNRTLIKICVKLLCVVQNK